MSIERGILQNLKRCTRPAEKYESSWEKEYMLGLDGDSAVKKWGRCRFRIPYLKKDGSEGAYKPDFIVEKSDGIKEIHEVKGGHLLSNDETRIKLIAGKEFCRKRGMVFKVITRKI